MGAIIFFAKRSWHKRDTSEERKRENSILVEFSVNYFDLYQSLIYFEIQYISFRQSQEQQSLFEQCYSMI